MASYADLVPLFTVERVEGDGAVYRPVEGLPHDDDRLLGGLVLGLSLRSAAATVDEDRRVHSLHGYFLRRGRSSQPLELVVDVLRDGRAFSVRRIAAEQNGVPIALFTASYVTGDADDDPTDWQRAPRGLPDPEAVTGPPPLVSTSSLLEAFDVRGAEPDDPDSSSAVHPYWARVRTALPDDPTLHASVVALMSDCGVSATACGPGTSVRDQLATASLDHAIWFHRPVRTDEWMLVSGRSQSDRARRGFAQAEIRAQDGRLVASIAQEALRVSRRRPRPEGAAEQA